MTQILCPFWCISIASVWSGFTEVRSVSIWVREISAMGANRYTKHIDEPVKVIPTTRSGIHALSCADTPVASDRRVQNQITEHSRVGFCNPRYSSLIMSSRTNQRGPRTSQYLSLRVKTNRRKVYKQNLHYAHVA